MQTEIEAKFLNVDYDEVRVKLKALGAECVQPMRLMRRKIFDFADGSLQKTKHGWVRIRDEGNATTLAYKQMDDRGVHGTKEISVMVSDFEATVTLLENIGLVAKSYP